MVSQALVKRMVHGVICVLPGLFFVSTALAFSIGENPVLPVKKGTPGGVVVGYLSASSECQKGQIEIFLSKGIVLLYQTDIPVGGSFEFHTVPGKFNLVAIGENGCMGEQTYEVKKGESKEINLSLSPSKNKKAVHSKSEKPFQFSILNQAYAQTCPTCGFGMNYGYMPFYQGPMPSFYSTYMPWYSPYGALSYSNFYSPAPWGGNGLDFGFYPGHGGGGMGKPNVYVSGPDGTPVKVRVDLEANGNFLAAVPRHGVKGWEGKIKNNHLLASDSTDYPYFFYDYRTNENLLQDQAGFCTDRSELVSRCADILKTLGFEAGEIQDFTQYWGIKMPSADQYCVFPQGNEVLDKLAPLEVSPSSAKVTRVAFVVVVDKALTRKKGQNFTFPPKKDWQPKKEAPISEKERQARVSVREWGVGFLKGNR